VCRGYEIDTTIRFLIWVLVSCVYWVVTLLPACYGAGGMVSSLRGMLLHIDTRPHGTV
jgi:hypothetical protein